jgi:uncharacterized protein YecE (DUF72 family)
MVHVTVGCSGFYYKDWRGIFYPDTLPAKKWFEFYCEHFNTLELNSTFYRFPRAEQLKAWYIKSPSLFSFSVKVPRAITHYNKFNNCKEMLNDFHLAVAEGLKEKAAYILYQLPASITYSTAALKKILKSMNSDFKNVIEFRHGSWWSRKVFTELALKNVIFCTISYPDLPDAIVVNNPSIYIRMHGIPDIYYSAYPNEILDNYWKEIQRNKYISDCAVYFNNTATVAAIKNATYLNKLILK